MINNLFKYDDQIWKLGSRLFKKGSRGSRLTKMHKRCQDLKIDECVMQVHLFTLRKCTINLLKSVLKSRFSLLAQLRPDIPGAGTGISLKT